MSTKIIKTQETNLIVEKRFFQKNDIDNELNFTTDLSDIETLDKKGSEYEEDFDDIEDYGFDFEPEDDDFQREMGIKDFHKKNKMSSFGIGDRVRWDKDSEKEYSPIKPDDLPLDKYLEMKKSKSENKKITESVIRQTYKQVLFEEKMGALMSQLKKELSVALTPEQKRVIKKELKVGGIEGLEDELENAYEDVKSELSEDMENDDKKLIKHHKKSELSGILTMLPAIGAAGGIFMNILQGENFEHNIELFALVLSSLVGFTYSTKQSDKAEEINKKMEIDAEEENRKIFQKLRKLQNNNELRVDVDGPKGTFAANNCYDEKNPKPEQWKKVGDFNTKVDSKDGKKYIHIRYCNSRNLNYLLKKAMERLDIN